MKYYLMETIQFNDGTKDSVGIYTYDTLDEATAKFHKELGGWGYGQKENVAHLLCMVVDSDGGIHEVNTWTNTNIPAEETEAE